MIQRILISMIFVLIIFSFNSMNANASSRVTYGSGQYIFSIIPPANVKSTEIKDGVIFKYKNLYTSIEVFIYPDPNSANVQSNHPMDMLSTGWMIDYQKTVKDNMIQKACAGSTVRSISKQNDSEIYYIDLVGKNYHAILIFNDKQRFCITIKMSGAVSALKKQELDKYNKMILNAINTIEVFESNDAAFDTLFDVIDSTGIVNNAARKFLK